MAKSMPPTVKALVGLEAPAISEVILQTIGEAFKMRSDNIEATMK